MTKFLVTSFYTINTGYEHALKGCLLPSLDKWGVKHDVVGIESKGAWGRNIYEKPHTVLRALEDNPELNVVWLDADAEVCRPLTHFETGCDGADFSFHKRFGKNYSTGTMFFRNRFATRKFVGHWAQACKNRAHRWKETTEQGILAEILPSHESYLVVKDLPLA